MRTVSIIRPITIGIARGFTGTMITLTNTGGGAGIGKGNLKSGVSLS